MVSVFLFVAGIFDSARVTIQGGARRRGRTLLSDAMLIPLFEDCEDGRVRNTTLIFELIVMLSTPM